ncbi:MAG: Fic family protein [Elusimicrobia bacterium]|nr:Fic family protein [Elusimicrobiota bacterium]
MNNDFRLPLETVWLLNAVAEHKGRQDLYTKQFPETLRALGEAALIQSAESSNRIEGVTVDRHRLKPLVMGRETPRDRSEEEVVGYRKALDLIHKKHKGLSLTPETILEIHRLCRGESWDAGKWKEKDNDIIRKEPNGHVTVLFRPVCARDTLPRIKKLCRDYSEILQQENRPALLSLACFVLDFLCIHPFRDGNGRVSRLLTLLALYRQGYMVGKYISLERLIEETKETYYETLNKSSQGWHENRQDVVAWVNYFLGTLLRAYREFERKARSLPSARGAKTILVRKAVTAQVGEFSLADIRRECPAVSRDMVKLILRRMAKERFIKSLGKGQSARWKKVVKTRE